MISNKSAAVDMRSNTVYAALCTATKKLKKETMKRIYHKHEAAMMNANVEVSDEDIYNFVLENIDLFLEDILYALFDLVDTTLELPDDYIADGINQYIAGNKEELAKQLVASDEDEPEESNELESAVADNVYKTAKDLFFNDYAIRDKLDAIYDKHMEVYQDVFGAHATRPDVETIERYLTENYTGDDIMSDVALVLLTDEHVMDITDNESILTLAADMLVNDTDIINQVALNIEDGVNY